MPGKKEEETKKDTNAWMTTYTDLMILLLTFFVLLLSLSTIDDNRKRLALNSVTGAFGFKPGAQSIMGSPDGLNITVGSAPLKKENIDFEKLRNVALKNAIEESKAKLTKEHERIVLTLGNRVLFEEGSSQLLTETGAYLSELVQILKDGPQRIELRGYTSHSETVFEDDPFKTAMILSSKRAMAVYHFFMEKGSIPPKRMVAHGLGIAPKNKRLSKKDMASDRQVEIILDYREPVPYRYRGPRWKGDSLLDFKGFLFRIPGEEKDE